MVKSNSSSEKSLETKLIQAEQKAINKHKLNLCYQNSLKKNGTLINRNKKLLNQQSMIVGVLKEQMGE